LRFAASENTFDYFHAAKAYMREWGKPLAFYSDKHGIFRTTHGSEKDRSSGLTQFGRALYELNIDIICANTPQAKGRVERANQTARRRLGPNLTQSRLYPRVDDGQILSNPDLEAVLSDLGTGPLPLVENGRSLIAEPNDGHGGG
jgi:hypothetical protein